MSYGKLIFKNYTPTDGAELFAKEGSVCVSYSHFMYIFGGMTPNGLSNATVQFDIDTKRFVVLQLQQAPQPRYSHACCLRGNQMYVFGGIAYNNEYMADLWVFDLDQHYWMQIECQHKLYGLANHCMAFYSDSEILIIGGYDRDGRFNQSYYLCQLPSGYFYEYYCSQQNDAPVPLIGSTLIRTTNGVYLIGGQASNGQCVSDVWRFASNRFYHISSNTYLTARAFHSAVLVGSNILIFGGRNGEGPKQVLNDFYNYSVENKSWRAIDNVNDPKKPARRQHCCMITYKTVKSKNKLLICGGVGDQNEQLADLWSITLTDNFTQDNFAGDAVVNDESCANSVTNINKEIMETKQLMGEKLDETAQQLIYKMDTCFGQGKIGDLLQSYAEMVQENEKKHAAMAQSLEAKIDDLTQKIYLCDIEQVADASQKLRYLTYVTQTRSVDEAIEVIVAHAAAGQIKSELQKLIDSQFSAQAASIGQLHSQVVETQKMVSQLSVNQANLQQLISDQAAQNAAVLAKMEAFSTTTDRLFKALQTIQTKQEQLTTTCSYINSRALQSKSVHFDDGDDRNANLRSSIIQHTPAVAPRVQDDGQQLNIEELSVDKLEYSLRSCKPRNEWVLLKQSDYTLLAAGDDRIAICDGHCVEIVASEANNTLESLRYDVGITALACDHYALILGFENGTVEYCGKNVRLSPDSAVVSACAADGKAFFGLENGLVMQVDSGTLECNVLYNAAEAGDAPSRITALAISGGSLLVGDQSGLVLRIDCGDAFVAGAGGAYKDAYDVQEGKKSRQSEQNAVRYRKQELYRHSDAVTSVAACSCANADRPTWVVSTSADKTMRVWSQEFGKKEVRAYAAMDYTDSLLTANLLISSGEDGGFRIWEYGNKIACLKCLKFKAPVKRFVQVDHKFFLLIAGRVMALAFE